MSRLVTEVNVRELALHIRRMALFVRAAVDMNGPGGPAARASGGNPGGDFGGDADGNADGNAGADEAFGGRSSGGCSSGGCSPGGCSSGGCSSGGVAGAVGEDEAAGRGWWVLAQGGVLDEADFAAREAAREALLARVRRAGILVGENVWVWDLSGRAQLVLATLPTLARARMLAKRLREKGLAIVVRREMPEGPTQR